MRVVTRESAMSLVGGWVEELGYDGAVVECHANARHPHGTKQTAISVEFDCDALRFEVGELSQIASILGIAMADIHVVVSAASMIHRELGSNGLEVHIVFWMGDLWGASMDGARS